MQNKKSFCKKELAKVLWFFLQESDPRERERERASLTKIIKVSPSMQSWLWFPVHWDRGGSFINNKNHCKREAVLDVRSVASGEVNVRHCCEQRSNRLLWAGLRETRLSSLTRKLFSHTTRRENIHNIHNNIRHKRIFIEFMVLMNLNSVTNTTNSGLIEGWLWIHPQRQQTPPTVNHHWVFLFVCCDKRHSHHHHPLFRIITITTKTVTSLCL
jgi:hypothetical protein